MTETEAKLPPRLAKVKAACAYASMGKTKLYERINSGDIIAYKRENDVLIDLDSIDEWHRRCLVRHRPRQTR